MKFIPCKLLLEILNDESKNLGFNQNLTDKAIKEIPEASYPITLSFLHSYQNVDAARCTIVLDKIGDTVVLDIPMTRYNELPNLEA